jgi:hypothetical protein
VYWWNVVCLRAWSNCLSRDCIQCFDWGICSSFALFCFFLYCRCWCFVVFLVTHVLCALLHIPLCFLCLVCMICHIFPLLCVLVRFSSSVFFFSLGILNVSFICFSFLSLSLSTYLSLFTSIFLYFQSYSSNSYYFLVRFFFFCLVYFYFVCLCQCIAVSFISGPIFYYHLQRHNMRSVTPEISTVALGVLKCNFWQIKFEEAWLCNCFYCHVAQLIILYFFY